MDRRHLLFLAEFIVVIDNGRFLLFHHVSSKFSLDLSDAIHVSLLPLGEGAR